MPGLSEAFDPRVMDPSTEEQWWRAQADRYRHSAFDALAAGGINTLGALGGFAMAQPGASRAHTALGRWFFGAPGERTRSVLGNTLGWGNVGLAGQRGYDAYQRGERAKEADAMANRWQHGLPPDLLQMIEEAYRPQPPVSR